MKAASKSAISWFSQMHAYSTYTSKGYLSPAEQTLWLQLHLHSNSLKWPEILNADNESLCQRCGMSEKTLIASRRRLIALGLITFNKGWKGHRSGYTLVPLYIDAGEGKVGRLRSDLDTLAARLTGRIPPAPIAAGDIDPALGF